MDDALRLDEQVALLAGTDLWHTAAVPRAGLPALRCSDGPNGVRGTSFAAPPSALFPCGAALGATWDPALVGEVGAGAGAGGPREVRPPPARPDGEPRPLPAGRAQLRGVRRGPAPHRAPGRRLRPGRPGRRRRVLREAPRRQRRRVRADDGQQRARRPHAARGPPRPVRGGSPRGRTCAPSWRPTTASTAPTPSESHRLLDGILRQAWGFDGLVVSDWFATHSTAPALRAGLDLEMPGPSRFRGERLLEAVRAGEADADDVARAADRVVGLLRWCGLPGTEPSTDERGPRGPGHGGAAAPRRRRRDGPAEERPRPPAAPAGPRGTRRLALLGPFAQGGAAHGGGSAALAAERIVTPRRGPGRARRRPRRRARASTRAARCPR